MRDKPLKKTPLHDVHLALGARMAPFGGYDMPIQYEGIVKEHHAARQQAALFDTCHMGEFQLRGTGALADLERLVSCRIESMHCGQCRYGLMCNEEGGVIDDLLVYRLASDKFMLVVNAGTQDDDYAWVESHCSSDTDLANLSCNIAKIDVQGPAAPRLVEQFLDDTIKGMRFYQFAPNRFQGEPVLVSRTGYTGEIGFEIYGEAGPVREFWRAAMDEGAIPAGLGARDTLRLEMGMPLYGHELNEARNAAEAGFTRAIAGDKEFIGSAALRDLELQPATLVGVALTGRRAAREGDRVCDGSGHAIGSVTSGSFGPSVGHAIALAYVDKGVSETGTRVQIETSRQTLEGEVVELPFYHQATARRRLRDFVGND